MLCMTQRPSGFKTQEDYNAYMSKYKAKQRHVKNFQDNMPLVKEATESTEELIASFNQTLELYKKASINQAIETATSRRNMEEMADFIFTFSKVFQDKTLTPEVKLEQLASIEFSHELSNYIRFRLIQKEKKVSESTKQ